MYPAHLLSLFPPHPRNNVVFVAMSFDRQFETLWTDVFEPAIADVTWDGARLHAHRGDLSRKGDSIITEIVQHIAESRLVLADISTYAWVKNGRTRLRPVRNSNVMYELGIAHAARLPEEVIVVRGDADPLDFDVSGVRVHQYAADPSSAKSAIANLINEALRAVDQQRSLAVRLALQSITPTMFVLLHSMGAVSHPNPVTMRDYLVLREYRDAIKELLAGGMFESFFAPLPVDFMERPTSELFAYRCTEFGEPSTQLAERNCASTRRSFHG